MVYLWFTVLKNGWIFPWPWPMADALRCLALNPSLLTSQEGREECHWADVLGWPLCLLEVLKHLPGLVNIEKAIENAHL